MREARPVVRLEALSKRYGDLAAVDGVSLTVARGEIFGLIGPDGAGKTTVLRLILGLLAPTHGTVRTCGLEPALRRRELSERVGYLAQRFSLYGDLSVEENTRFFAGVRGLRNWKPRRDELLARLRLDPFRDRLADRLSGGMKQKLALAVTLLHTPELLVLDEPTAGVDPVSRRDFWKILAELCRDGMTVFLTTPYLDEAERCSRVGLMNRGKLLFLDSPAALRARSPGAVLEVLARPRREAASLLRALPDVLEVETFGERLHVTLRGPADRKVGDLGAALAASGIEVAAIRAAAPSLEDLFISTVRSTEVPS